jgi:putative flippase GtrA
MTESLALPHRRLVTPARLAAMLRFLKFGVVGTLGFVWDTVTVYAAAPWIGLYAAGLVAYLVASTLNWLLNRLWTFRNHEHGRAYRQWALFVLSGAGGFVLNRGTFFALVATVPLCRGYPVLAVAAGSLAGMFVNFAMASRVVFRPR